MRIDLHTHSTCSDGTDSPADLVAKAAASGLDVVALTDHDTTAGWDAAERAAAETGIRLVRGVELSTRNQGQSQHLLGYEPDPSHAGLVEMLRAGAESRDGRLPTMLRQLREAGVADLSVEDVAAHAGGGSTGRPHVADALVTAGVCRDRADAFTRFLTPGGPGYVRRFVPDIAEAIGTVVAAGGVAVIAHPWGRKTHVTEERFADLADVGLSGIEVDHQEHDAGARDALRAIARNLGLVATGSSDHHGLGKVDHDLGCNTTAPAAFERLLPAHL